MALRAVSRGDVAAACERLSALAAGDVTAVTCDVSALHAELAAIDALARLGLIARRLGCPLRVRRASPQLRELVAFCGLGDALGVGWDRRQPEQGEQAVGVQERVEPGDPAV
jgi:hypothetical protein